MADEITDTELQEFLNEGLSQNEISRRTGIPRSTIRRRLQSVGTPDVSTSTHGEPKTRKPQVYQGTHMSEQAINAGEDLQEMLDWWRRRKHVLQTEDDPEQETQRQTYHVQKRYIEAIKRASDIERVSIMEIVNRAFKQFFTERA